jgi:hypothetical protein
LASTEAGRFYSVHFSILPAEQKEIYSGKHLNWRVQDRTTLYTFLAHLLGKRSRKIIGRSMTEMDGDSFPGGRLIA